MSTEELDWLRKTCPFFDETYLNYLANFRFKPEQVHVEFNLLKDDPERGQLEISIVGPWVETILWEVPLMACLSEIYFQTADTDWSYEGQEGADILAFLIDLGNDLTTAITVLIAFRYRIQ